MVFLNKYIPLILTLAGLAAAMLVAGCGGGNGGNDAERAATSPGSGEAQAARQPPGGEVTASSAGKAAFVKRADKVCIAGAQSVYGEINKAFEASGRSATAASVSAVEAFERMVRRVVGEIRELGAPRGDEAQVEAVLASMQQAVDTARERRVSSLEELAQLFGQSDSRAKSYGIEACIFG